MVKVTLDMSTFKALASDTRLDILKTLDGKRMALKDISKATNLNKATLHEHLSKLNEAGLVKKKEREGHKWVYYKLTWKGECLLHPENTKIVVLFTTTFLTLCVGIVNFINYAKGYIVGKAVNLPGSAETVLYSYSDLRLGSADDGINYAMEKVGRSINIPSQAPIDTVPIEGQTTGILTQKFLENTNLKGALGNTINPTNLEVKTLAEGTTDTADVILNLNAPSGVELDAGGQAVTSLPQNMAIINHDPAFQYIAIVCIVIFSLLICFSIYKFWKSKKPML